MVYLVVSAIHAEGKGREAWDWVVKAVAYVNEHYSEQNSQILSNINGPANQGHWVRSHESLAAMEEFSRKLNEDSDFQELSAVGLTLWGDRVTNLSRTVP